MAEKIRNSGEERWIIVFSGLILNLCLGSIYAYSVLQVPLRKAFEDLGHRISATEMLLPFIVFLVFFAATMPLAGKYIERYGPRRVAYIGAILLSLGWFSASFATSPIQLVFLYGFLGGIGVGIAYNCPIVTVGRWFLDKRGLALGITLFGFGFSAAVIAPILDLLTSRFGIFNSLRILGIAFFIIMMASASFLRFPDRQREPENLKMEQKRSALAELSREEIVKTRTFYGLWSSFAIGTLAGLMAIGISKPAGLEVAENAGIPEDAVAAMLTALMVPFALLNGLGRPFFGALVDRFGPRKTAMLSFSLIFSASLLLFLIPYSLEVYAIAFGVLWFNLGGWLATAPASTAYFFGLKDYARNYGLVYTAYGVGAVVGNLLAGLSKDLLGSYLLVFQFVMLLAVIGIIVAFATLKLPKAQ